MSFVCDVLISFERMSPIYHHVSNHEPILPIDDFFFQSAINSPFPTTAICYDFHRCITLAETKNNNNNLFNIMRDVIWMLLLAESEHPTFPFRRIWLIITWPLHRTCLVARSSSWVELIITFCRSWFIATNISRGTLNISLITHLKGFAFSSEGRQTLYSYQLTLVCFLCGGYGWGGLGVVRLLVGCGNKRILLQNILQWRYCSEMASPMIVQDVVLYSRYSIMGYRLVMGSASDWEAIQIDSNLRYFEFVTRDV